MTLQEWRKSKSATGCALVSLTMALVVAPAICGNDEKFKCDADPLPIGGMYDGLIYGTATTTFSAISLDGLSMELPNTQGDETVKVLLPSPIVASDAV